MTVRERFLNCMNFKSVDRMPQIEMFPWWNKTIERWHGEKLDKSLTDREDICTHFGLETYKLWWYSRRRAANRPLGHLGTDGQLDLYREKQAELFPWPVVDGELWREWARLQSEGKTAVWVEFDGFFWFPREVLGVERNLYASYDEPEMLHILNNDLLDYTLRVLEEICKYCVPDMIMMSEDMSYNNGPMVSKDMFDTFIAPYYKKLLKFIKQRNMLTLIDTDGNVHKLAEWFYELGIDGLLPNERQAGVDLVKLRDKFPKMLFIGGFDKTLMHLGETAMRKEFERLLPVAKQGGYIISCDHQTPPEVSYDDYKLYVKLLLEYSEKASQK